MILLDANVFMYAAGRPHAHKASSVELLERVATGTVDATTDAEVLQEILYRYRSIGRWQDGREVYSLVRRIVPDTLLIDSHTVDLARDLMVAYPLLQARDAIHAAACIRNNLDGICTFDSDFAPIKELRTLSPDSVLATR